MSSQTRGGRLSQGDCQHYWVEGHQFVFGPLHRSEVFSSSSNVSRKMSVCVRLFYTLDLSRDICVRFLEGLASRQMSMSVSIMRWPLFRCLCPCPQFDDLSSDVYIHFLNSMTSRQMSVSFIKSLRSLQISVCSFPQCWQKLTVAPPGCLRVSPQAFCPLAGSYQKSTVNLAYSENQTSAAKLVDDFPVAMDLVARLPSGSLM